MSIRTRADCREPSLSLRAGFSDQADAGPCVFETSDAGEEWTLLASWNKEASEGSSGDGPCIDMAIIKGAGATGAAWCDLPEARIIGEWTSTLVGSELLAWGPVAAGRIVRVRIEFAEGPPFQVLTKPTPWDEFDYWYVTLGTNLQPVALVALDADDSELAREDISGYPSPTESPTPIGAPS